MLDLSIYTNLYTFILGYTCFWLYISIIANRSGDIAAVLGVKINSLGPVRAKLIKKGMIYSPTHGDMAFTVPLFDEFMRRAIPEFEGKG